MARGMLLIAAAMIVLTAGLCSHRADAMTFSSPSALAAAAANAALVRPATVVCGTNGCAPVPTKRVPRHQLHH
jgi:hypothetical protein